MIGKRTYHCNELSIKERLRSGRGQGRLKRFGAQEIRSYFQFSQVSQIAAAGHRVN
jgi:hypothetical protein